MRERTEGRGSAIAGPAQQLADLDQFVEHGLEFLPVVACRRARLRLELAVALAQEPLHALDGIALGVEQGGCR